MILNKLKNTQTIKNPTNNTKTTFHTRIINNTDIIFSNDEITLLNKGLRYILHFKHKNWITTLPFEAETAINLLPPSE